MWPAPRQITVQTILLKVREYLPIQSSLQNNRSENCAPQTRLRKIQRPRNRIPETLIDKVTIRSQGSPRGRQIEHAAPNQLITLIEGVNQRPARIARGGVLPTGIQRHVKQ